MNEIEERLALIGALAGIGRTSRARRPKPSCTPAESGLTRAALVLFAYLVECLCWSVGIGLDGLGHLKGV